MSTTTQINLDLSYSDYSERTYKIPYDPENITLQQAKERIQAFNTAAADTSSTVAQTFVSKSGAPVARITSAMILRRTEDVIYSG